MVAKHKPQSIRLSEYYEPSKYSSIIHAIATTNANYKQSTLGTSFV